MVPYEDCRIKGPYFNKDCRKYLNIYFSSGELKVVTFARYTIELKLGRYLERHEHVHHKDGNCMNDSIENLELINDSDHAKLHMTKYQPEVFNCPLCNKEFSLSGEKYRNYLGNKKRNSSYKGPYCSQYCANRYVNKFRWRQV